MKYQPPFGPNWPNVANPNGPYTNGNPPAGIKGSVPPASAWEYPMREIVHMIQKGGYAPADPVLTDPAHDIANPNDPNLFQLTQGARRALYAWGIDTGSANSLSVALDPPLTAYASGLEIRVLVAANNTAAATIRVNGLPTQQIVKKDGSTLMAGDLRAGGIAVFVHDGTNFQLVSGAAGSTTITDGWFNGADYMVDVGSANHIIGTPAIAPVALSAGQSFLVLVKTANLASINSGAVDINVNNLGFKPLVFPTGLPLEAGDIVGLMLIRISYDGSKFSMLSPIDMAIISSPVTKSVGPDAGADFADLAFAFSWASRRRIDNDGKLTFAMQGQTGTAKVHNYSKDVVIDHPDGQRIWVQGPGMNFIPSPGHFGAGNFSNVGPGQPAAITSEGTGWTNTLRTAFQTELKFTGTFGIKVVNAAINIASLLVTGKGLVADGQTLVSATQNASIAINCLGACLCTVPLMLDNNSQLNGINFYAFGMTHFVGISHGSRLSVGGTNCTFMVGDSLTDGIQMTFNSTLHLNCQETWPRVFSCQNVGVNHWGDSPVHAEKLTLVNCWGFAAIHTNGSASYVPFGSVTSGYRGYAVTFGSLDCNTCNTVGVQIVDYYAAFNSEEYAAAFQNGAAQFSPTRNTIGNSNSTIVA